jgi:tRNA(Ile)-lysidine synthase
MSLIIIPEKVYQFSRSFFQPGVSVVAGVSGGSDSVALLFLLFELRNRLGIKSLVVAHVNHGLRGEESDADERLVCSYAEKLGLPFFTRRLQGHIIDEPGLEAWAREERYRFFRKIREQTGSTLIATGHTMDDQAETVMMRIVRGTGLNGLRGILPLRDDGTVRPLLTIRKQELLEWLAARSIDYRQDGSNSDLHLFRNRVRHTLIPVLEATWKGAIPHIAAIASEAYRQWDARYGSVTEWIGRTLFAATENSFRLKAEELLDKQVAAEGVRRIFAEKGITPDRLHIEELLENSGRTGGTFLIPEGWWYQVGGGVVYFFKTITEFLYRITVPGVCDCPDEGRVMRISRIATPPDHLNQGKWTVLLDGDSIGNECVYRNIYSVDTFVPFGKTREVNVLHFLSKQGVPLPLRRLTGILVSADNKPIWIPGIRLDNRFRITKTTKSVIKVQSESIL